MERETTADVSSSLDEAGGRRPWLEIRWVFPPSEQAPALPAPADELTIGRDDDCEVKLESSGISRRHACIRRVGPLQLITDLQSKNGVFVNARRVQQAALSRGDVVRLGECLGVVVGTDGTFRSDAQWIDERIFGGNEIAEIVVRARKAAQTKLPIVLQGETGTGKELLARAIHAWSGETGPFVVVKCATLSRDAAALDMLTGTVMFDEVTELSPDGQALVLGAVERSESGERIPVQVVSTSQVPLARAVADDDFRADLRGRLEGMTFVLPPLRDRRADIVPLFVELVQRHSTPPPEFSVRLLERLTLYDWPGNVRELELLVRRLLLLHGERRLLRTEHLAQVLELPVVDDAQRPSSMPPRSRRRDPDPDELSALQQSLEQHRGNLSRAAQELGISRPKAYRLLQADRATAGNAPPPPPKKK